MVGSSSTIFGWLQTLYTPPQQKRQTKDEKGLWFLVREVSDNIRGTYLSPTMLPKFIYINMRVFTMESAPLSDPWNENWGFTEGKERGEEFEKRVTLWIERSWDAPLEAPLVSSVETHCESDFNKKTAVKLTLFRRLEKRNQVPTPSSLKKDIHFMGIRRYR